MVAGAQGAPRGSSKGFRMFLGFKSEEVMMHAQPRHFVHIKKLWVDLDKHV